MIYGPIWTFDSFRLPAEWKNDHVSGSTLLPFRLHRLLWIAADKNGNYQSAPSPTDSI